MIDTQSLDEGDLEINGTLAALSASVYIQIISIRVRMGDVVNYSTFSTSLVKTVHHKDGRIMAGIRFWSIGARFCSSLGSLQGAFFLDFSTSMQILAAVQGNDPYNSFNPLQQSELGGHTQKAPAFDPLSCPPPAHTLDKESPLLVHPKALYTSNIVCIWPAPAHVHAP